MILTSASSSANAFLYVGSRYLFALAQNKHAPQFLLRCSKTGVPYYCVAITSSVSLLTYLSVRKGGPTLVFTWFQNLTTVAFLFTWCCICIAYIRFYHALKAQNVDRNTLAFKSPFQPYTAYITLAFFIIIIIFNGFHVFVGQHHQNWNVSGKYHPFRNLGSQSADAIQIPRCIPWCASLLCTLRFLEDLQGRTPCEGCGG